ncbi:MAG: 60 kDa chaperonin [Candidatus Anoxychlamydiales bacterium]|nr:60 kDa chaperonin [Candidatus Anoxychlamydiales bacterium]
MAKIFEFNDKALRSILNGIKTLAKVVKVTLGPKGKNVLIKKDFDLISTKDGVSVAEEIFLKDKFENMAVQIVKEASKKTANEAGDGTTTAIVLAEAIFSEGLKNVMAGTNPIFLKRGIEKTLVFVYKYLDEMKSEIRSKDEIKQIATISANNDVEIGSIIAEAIDKVGKDGIVSISDKASIDTTLDIVEGMEFNSGFLSPYFITNPEKMMVEFENPVIFVTDKKLISAKDVASILEKIMQKEVKSLLIIAEDIDSDALTTLVVNKVKANLPIAAVKAPFFGDRKKEFLNDIATLTNAKVITEDIGLDLNSFDESYLGKAKKIKISKENTTIIDGFGSLEEIKKREMQIKNEIAMSTSDYDIEKLTERLANLVGKVALINVGAATEIEMKEKKQRIDDALNATKAAMKDGIVPGGGVALLRCLSMLDDIEVENPDEKIAIEIIKKAIAMPAIVIANNAGKKGDVIAEKILEKKGSLGYNAYTDKFSDLIKDGVIDPVLVTKTALKNAASIATLLLTTATMITEKPKAKKNTPMMDPSMMDPSLMGAMGGMPPMGM